MKFTRVVLLVGALFSALALPVHADVLNMKSVGEAPPNAPGGVLRPTRGMSMDQVSRQFGQPAEVVPAVGEPPITRWIYDKFTVYFEHQYVIHSVVNRK
jgi:hypothetical protein